MNDDIPDAAGGRVSRAPLLIAVGVVTVVLLTLVYVVSQRGSPASSTEPATAPTSVARPNIEPPPSDAIINELSVAAREREAAAAREEAAEAARQEEAETATAGEGLQPGASPLSVENAIVREMAEIVVQEAVRRAETRHAEYLAALSAGTTIYQADYEVPQLADLDLADTTVSTIDEDTHELAPGTVIRGTLISAIDTEAPGTVLGQVAANVYDSASGEVLLVPQGARLVGDYRGVDIGAERVQVAFHNLVLPDGTTIALEPPWPASDAAGNAGLTGDVDRRFGQNVGNALLLSGIGAGVQLSQPRTAVGQNYSGREIAAAESGRQLGELGTEYARQGLNLAPTIRVESGNAFTSILSATTRLPAADNNTGISQ